MPVSAYFRLIKGSKILPISRVLVPTPEWVTVIVIKFSSFIAASMSIRPCCDVNLTAFESRVIITCLIALRSPKTRILLSMAEISSVTSF